MLMLFNAKEDKQHRNTESDRQTDIHTDTHTHNYPNATKSK